MNKDNRRMDVLLKKLEMFHKLGKKSLEIDAQEGWGGGVKEQREEKNGLCKPNKLAKEKLSAHNTDPAEALGDVKK